MAEQLGQAELILTLNDDALRTGLRQLQNDLQNLNTEIRPRVSSSGGGSARGSGTVRGASTPVGDLGRQVQAARDLNLNTNWGVALRTLGEVDSDLALIGASQELNLRQGWTVALQQLTEIAQDLESVSTGRDFNIQNSWRTALGQLSEIDADLRQVAAGDRLNLNSSWTKALTQLAEVNEDLRLISNAERLNLNSSWTQALTQLQEIDADLRLISAGQNLNLNTSWTAALSDLNDIKADLDLIAAGRDLNLRTSWQNFLQQLEEVKADLDASSRQQANTQTKDTIRGRIAENRRNPSGFGDASRDNFGVSRQTKSDQLEADLARVRAERIKAEKEAADAAKAQARAERKAAKDAQTFADRRKQRNKDIVGNALIGGAFPLLFGQGIGASFGGGLGGAGGGAIGGQFGFGLSLIGTAVGQQIDVAIQKLGLLGAALSDPVAKFSELAQASVLSGRSVERQAEALISTGRAAEAAALIQEDLAKTYGDLTEAKKLAEATDELNRAFAELGVKLVQTITPAIAGFTKAIADQFNEQNTSLDIGKRVRDLRSKGQGNRADQLANRELEIALAENNARNFGIAPFLGDRFQKQREALLKEFGGNQTTGPAVEQRRQADEAKTLRTDLLRLSQQLAASDAQGNKVLSDAVKLTSSYKQERLDLLNLSEKDRNGPKGQQIREQAAKERQQIREAAKAAAETSARELKNAKELIGQYGNQRQILEEQQKIAEAKRKADQADAAAQSNKFTDPANVAALENARLAAANNYNRVRIEGEQKIRELQAQTFAEQVASLNRLADLQDQISIANQRASGNLTGAGVGALQTAAGLEAAKRREQDAQAQLRVRPTDQGLQNAAKEAAKQTQLAAANARADLIEASKAAELSVRNIAQSLQDAVLAQQQLVGTDQGLTNILGGQAAANRQQQVNAELQQAVRAIKEEFIKSLGPNADPAVVNAVNRKEFGGSLGDQNRQMIQFIEAARQEMRGAQGIDDIQQQLVKAQNDLVTINGKLYEVNQQVVTAVSKLAEKNWTVNVNVPGGSASGDVVGAINSRT